MIETENVKIMDFGIAKAGGGMTSAGQVLGTPAYMSPEQVRGKTLDGRSDLFSYGVCLYEMVTGEKPFQGQNVTTIIYKIMTEEPIPPRELDVTIHPGISAVIIKALAKNPDHRHQSGAELLEELENYKSFGTDLATTKSMPAMSSGVLPAAESPAPIAEKSAPSNAAVVKAPVVAPKSAAAAASAHGQHKPATPAAAKAEIAPASGSTVKVAHGAKKTTPPSTDKRKQAIIAGVVLVLLTVGIILFKRISSPVQSPPQPATTTSQNTPAQSNPSAAVPPGQVSQSASSAHEELKKPKPTAVVEKAANSPESAPVKKQQPKQVSAVEAPAAAPPVTAASSPDLGSMHISSTPAGAKVTIGSVSQEDWVTPFTAQKLAPGDYELTFTKAGFVTQKRHVNVIAGKSASMGIDLSEAGAKVTVTSVPAGANILVDGKPTGKVTPSVLVVDAGTHEIGVRSAAGQAENVSVSLKDGEAYTFAPNLVAQRPGGSGNPFRKLKHIFGSEQIPEGKGMVQIKTNPAGAIVMHRGKAWPQLTPIKGPMDPGTYQITIRMEGYKPVRRDFIVEKGKTTQVDAELERRDK
jgi:serine/threonine-protein kinase